MKVRNEKGAQASDAKKLPRGHYCHFECLLRWKKKQKKCSMCQYDIAQLFEAREEETSENDNADGENHNNINYEENYDNINDEKRKIQSLIYKEVCKKKKKKSKKRYIFL